MRAHRITYVRDPDGWRRLVAMIIIVALKDAQRGDMAAGCWLETVGATWAEEILEMDGATIARWRDAEEVPRDLYNWTDDAELARKRAARREGDRRRALNKSRRLAGKGLEDDGHG